MYNNWVSPVLLGYLFHSSSTFCSLDKHCLHYISLTKPSFHCILCLLSSLIICLLYYLIVLKNSFEIPHFLRFLLYLAIFHRIEVFVSLARSAKVSLYCASICSLDLHLLVGHTNLHFYIIFSLLYLFYFRYWIFILFPIVLTFSCCIMVCYLVSLSFFLIRVWCRYFCLLLFRKQLFLFHHYVTG